MSPAELLTFLQEFYRDTLGLFDTRLGIARSVAGYDANNGYQQVLGRQEVHLRWLTDAIAALGGTASESPEQGGNLPTPNVKALIERDAASQKAFIERWAPLVARVTNARHQKMLGLILGEMKEHLRVLQQAAEGRADLLGRHAAGKVLRGSVIAARPRN